MNNITNSFNKIIQKEGNELFKEFQQSIKELPVGIVICILLSIKKQVFVILFQ